VLVLSVIVLLIWVYLLLFHGRFWQVRRFLEPVQKPTQQRRIAAIIPARNEADVIGRAVSSLINQNLDALFVVDDNSEDGTANAALAAAHRAGFSDKLTVIRGTELPPGWTAPVLRAGAFPCSTRSRYDPRSVNQGVTNVPKWENENLRQWQLLAVARLAVLPHLD
jgi:cellulose synthase/poly-beta-1,6-N-acetylglucosamine synthase-like glycosyltransferase